MNLLLDSNVFIFIDRHAAAEQRPGIGEVELFEKGDCPHPIRPHVRTKPAAMADDEVDLQSDRYAMARIRVFYEPWTSVRFNLPT